MLGVYNDPPDLRAGLGRERRRCSSARSRRPDRRVRRSARHGSRTRWCRCASSARATCRAPTSSRPSLVPGMFGMFFMGALYMQRVLGYDPLEVGLAFLPATLAMGTMSLQGLRPGQHALRRQARLYLRPALRDRRRPAAVRPHAGRRQLLRRPPAGDGPARDRRRPRLPGADDARHVGRRPRATRASLPASSTPASRSAARSASRCWRRSRPSAPTSCSPRGGRREALNSGYHLAYLVGRGPHRRRDRDRVHGPEARADAVDGGHGRGRRDADPLEPGTVPDPEPAYDKAV